jgi:hypothetical protein
MGTLSGTGSDGTPAVTGIGTGAVGVFGDSDINGVLGMGSGTANGVEGQALQSGSGVFGQSSSGYGVHGRSQATHGIYGLSTGLGSGSTPSLSCGVFGDSQTGYGLFGASQTAHGVCGVSGASSGSKPSPCGVFGDSQSGYGVYGASKSSEGVSGSSQTGNGVHGVNGSGSGSKPSLGCGVFGDSENGYGVYGASKSSDGVYGVHGSGSGSKPSLGCGVLGDSENGYGVYAASKSAEGVYAVSASGSAAAATGENSAGGPGVHGKSSGNAGWFEGNVLVTATLTAQGNVSVTGNVTAKDVLLGGADCAENFDVGESEVIEPGTVVVFDDFGALSATAEPYNKRVAGVISGAGRYRPGIVLDGRESDTRRAPVALIGKVYCKVDARFAPIAVGDLLTTSATAGHAMKAQDPLKAFGAVIGKALAGLKDGCGLIPILVTLQ